LADPFLAAQSTPSASAPAAAKDDAVVLSPFVVTETEDRGYQATSTLAGTRLRTDLRDVGAAISVVTSQFMIDTGSTNLRDILVYTTNTEAGGFEGNFSGVSTGNGFANAEGTLQNPSSSTRVRGLAGADLTRDFFLTGIPMDGYNTERVDISRGANAILFGLGSPAGIINNQLKSASLSKDTYIFQQSIGRFDSHREVLDLNQTIVKHALAVRLISLNDRKEYQQRPAYELDRRLFGSLKWEPRVVKDGLTQFQVSYEGGRQNSNRPRPTPPHDGLSVWYNVLNKIAVDPTNTTSVTNNPFLFAHLNFPARWIGQVGAIFTDPNSATQGGNGVPPFMIASGGTPYTQLYAVAAYTGKSSNPNFFLNQQFAPTGQAYTGLWRYQELRDPSVFDFYHTLLDGPNKREAADFRALNATFRQTFWRDLAGVELAYDRQVNNRENFGMFGFDAYTIMVDMNSKLVDGAPNPNFGRPFVASDSIGNNFAETKREAYRATAYGTLDFRKKAGLARFLGRHVFTGNYTDQRSNNFNRSINGYSYGLELNAYANNQNATTYPAYAGVHYLGSSIANLSSPAGANISGITAVHTPQASGTAIVFDARINQMVRVPVTTLSADERDISKLYSGASKNFSKTKSVSAVWQGYLFSDKLVGLVGWREDDFKLWDAGSPRLAGLTGEVDPYSPAWALPAAPTIKPGKESTLSWSGVLHAPNFVQRWLPRGTDFSLSYNQSQNFRPSSTLKDVYGRPFSPPSGKTKDMGVTISALDQKLILRVNRYRTTQANDNATFYNTFWPGNDVTRAMNGMRQANTNEHLINKWFGFSPSDPRYLPPRASLTAPAQANNLNPALTAAETTFRNAWFAQRTREEWLRPVDPLLASSWNFTQAANGGNWSAFRPDPVGNIADTVSEGWEFEGTLNPTKNWRITYNAAMQEAQKSNVGADFTEFIKKNLPLWTDGNGRLATNIRDMEGFEDITYFGSFGTSQLGNLAINNMYVPYLNALAANGSPVQELRRWRFNVVTNYDFRAGRLKGFSIGGAARWQDRVAIGFPVKKNEIGSWVYDVTRPIYGSDEINYDAWLRYGRRILNDKIRWSVQLNVRDLYGPGELIAVTAQPNGQVASARIPQPNKWTITNSFEF
jgi:outer membrane receptor for ferric coprogen and ferric-rhodotorulic acid